MNQQLIDWLSSFGCTEIKPCRVRIGKQTWEAAEYHDPHLDAHSPQQKRLYVLGELPKSYQRSRRTAYPYKEQDWYISTYMQDLDSLKEEQRSYHPFGKHFQLIAWDAIALGEAIDAHEKRPYKRFPLELAYYLEQSRINKEMEVI